MFESRLIVQPLAANSLKGRWGKIVDETTGNVQDAIDALDGDNFDRTRLYKLAEQKTRPGRRVFAKTIENALRLYTRAPFDDAKEAANIGNEAQTAAPRFACWVSRRTHYSL